MIGNLFKLCTHPKKDKKLVCTEYKNVRAYSREYTCKDCKSVIKDKKTFYAIKDNKDVKD